jgi:hypothetical protein
MFAHISSANITSALPYSLARYDKPWCSNEMRSTAASMLLERAALLAAMRDQFFTKFALLFDADKPTGQLECPINSWPCARTGFKRA